MHYPLLRLLFTLLVFAGLSATSQAQTTTPYLYHNAGNNFAGAGLAASEYRGLLGVHSHRFTFSSPFTGNNFYKVNNQSDNFDNDFNSPGGSNVWSGSLSLNTLGTAFDYGDGNGNAGSFPVTAGKFYTYIWEDVSSGSNARAIVMETDNSPVDIVSVIASPPADPTPAQPVSVTVTLSGVPSPQENVYLRYSTDFFATYGTLLNPTSGAGTATQTFMIPAQPDMTFVQYYIFTSTLSNATLAGDEPLTDLATIAFDNNTGDNYFYTVATPLPVALTRFEAVAKGQTVVLEWVTVSETNNSHFELERSADSRTWVSVATVAGQGAINKTQQYNWRDVQPLAGRSYYRLRQVDTDGRAQYSAVRTVELGQKAAATVAPNPVQNGVLQLSLPANDAAVSVRLLDAQGRLLRTWTFDASAARTIPLDLSGMPAGVLFLQVDGATPLRVVKE